MIVYCWSAPPDAPTPMTCSTGPKASMRCSFTIIAVSAESTWLQWTPKIVSVECRKA